MKKKDVRKLLKEHPDFSNWLKQDPAKMSSLRSNPEEATKLMAKWKSETKKRMLPSFDLGTLSEKSRKASQMLGNIQTMMEMFADYSKKESDKF